MIHDRFFRGLQIVIYGYMEFFACFHEFYNMGKKNRGVKKATRRKI